ncbi:MAG TPA: hypothetical protein VE685_13095 [Thermoanaerobaculia bacterium]|nr:hypothetical protein [Thermoanaerobaculia bacterium]
MRALARKATLLFLLTSAFLLDSLPARAFHLRGARIWWCANAPESDGRVRVDFSIEVAYEGSPGLTSETFHFGDGTSTSFLLEPAAIHSGWYVGRGTLAHHYAPGTTVEARLETCCRIDGTNGLGLNNGPSGPLTVKVQLELRNPFCADPIINPYVRWLSGGLGDTFEIPNNVSGGWDACRLPTPAEMGGVPQPDGLTIDPATCVLTWTPVSGDPAKVWATQVRVSEDGVGDSAFDFLLGFDADRPLCRVDRIEPGPPTRVHVLVHDPRSGLQSILVTEAVNTTVQVPPFTEGDTVPRTVVGTKVQQNQSSRLELLVRDVAGNVTACDPILTEVVRATGRPERHVYAGIPAAERFVTVLNGDPGLHALAVEVNGRKFQMTGLRPGEERTLDVGSQGPPEGTSTFSLTAHGKPGGSAVVMIWDGNGLGRPGPAVP